jgi:two-component system, NtrC family, response regulator AtoC
LARELAGMWLAPTQAMPLDARILVADDDPELLDVVAEGLTRLGAHVTRASNGAELIDHLAEDGPFDLVVTDIAMPWLTGLRAIHAARTAGLGTPVIVMTALRDEGIPARVKALGANAVLLEKPFDFTALESVASKLLAQRRREPIGRAVHE